jgi:hypothetical protein
MVNETMRTGEGSGKVVINELTFFEGNMKLYTHPKTALTGDTNPIPYRVWCSSVKDRFYPCWKAFDKDTSGPARFESANIGRKGPYLTSPVTVTIDLGPDTHVLPTAIRIACDSPEPEGSRLQDCPRAFAVLGSTDGSAYDLLYSRTLLTPEVWDHQGSGPQAGAFFSWAYHSPRGRPVGERCGSCDTGPAFQCRLGAFDYTCATTFCGADGRCSSRPFCPPGSFHPGLDNGTGLAADLCLPCPAGRWGRRAGLETKLCEGVCPAGFYCPEGTVEPRGNECGGRGDLYCPEGSWPSIKGGRSPAH